MIRFSACGHPNLLGTHKTTLEFTKDKELTKNGSCIIGVNSDFNLSEIKKLDKDNIKIIIKVDELRDEISCTQNREFNSENEIVIRLGEFKSERTLGTRADKAAKHINRKIIEKLKNPEQKMIVEIR